MSATACPICRTPAARDVTRAFPFCSERCRQIDLGNWLSEVYRVPGEPIDPAELPAQIPEKRDTLTP